jgi:ABC-2 type transport system ATP-binding protein
VDNTTAGSVILRSEGLSKSYGNGMVLEDLSFELHRGRVMGFLGPNGAGKTTSIRILTTIMLPSAGRFEIDGVGSEHPARIRSRIGVLPESLGLPNQITGLEYVTYFAQLYGWKRAPARRHALELLELVGLHARSARLIRTYSHGMRQRLGIARALVNDPVVLFLDEPVVGLDPKGQQDLLVLMRDVAARRNAGIILCSHSLADVEGACDDVVILSAGRTVASGPLADVLADTSVGGTHRAALRLRVPNAFVERAGSTLREMPLVSEVSSVVDGQLRVVVTAAGGPILADRAANEILQRLIGADVPLLGFEIEGSRLTDVFMQLTRGGSL